MNIRSQLLIFTLGLALMNITSTLHAENIVFPADAGVVDVTQPPYNAAGDGETDDTAAIQQAIEENKGRNRTLYFPNGTYLVSDSLGIFDGEAHSRDRFLTYQGQSEAGAIIKLKDNAAGFDDPENSKIVLSVYEGDSTGDTMYGYVYNLTVDVGRGNAGAVGLRFMANNYGGVYHATIRSSDPDGAGHIGLDMRQSQNGPNLVKHVTVEGFDYGVQTGNSFALVFEHLTLRNQNVAGFDNVNARTTIRGLTSENRVPALRNRGHGHMTLIEGQFTGGSTEHAAVVNETPYFYTRDLEQEGYGQMLQRVSGDGIGGDRLDEWHEGPAQTLFAVEAPASLRLAIKETPVVPWEQDLDRWVKVDNSGGNDVTLALQQAIDTAAREGKTTIYFPRLHAGGVSYKITGPIRVHGSVNRILGLSNNVDIDYPAELIENETAVFTFENLTSDAIVVERFFLLGGWEGPADMYLFENRSGKTVVVRNFSHSGIFKKPDPGGEWFLEDVSPSQRRTSTLLIGEGEQCWIRQFNPENPERNMIEVDGGHLWLLGLKTEGRSRHLVARNGANVELLGGVSYQSWRNQKLDPPMFTIVDSNVSITFGFYHWQLPFTTIVQETVGDQTRVLLREDMTNDHLPLYRSGGTHQ